RDAVVDAAEPVVEPAELLPPEVQQRLRPEVDVAGPALGPPLPERVDPRPDQDLLPPPRPLGGAVRPHPPEVVERPLEEDVVPAAEAVGGDVDPGVILLDVPEPLPVRPVVGVADPVAVELAHAAGPLVAGEQRQVPEQRRVVLLG